MRRREFIALFSSAAVGWPLATRAQDAGRTYRLGTLAAGPRSAAVAAGLVETLRKSGFIEGQNLTVDWRGFAQQPDLIPQIAAELVKAEPDAIVASGDAAIHAVQKATVTIPILGVTEDMVGSGLVSSLSHPESNTTGVSILSSELDIKRQEVLIDAVPGLRAMAAIVDTNATQHPRLDAMLAAARARRVDLALYRISKAEEILPAIDKAKASGAGAMNVLASPVFYGNRLDIMKRAAALSLPAIYQFSEMAAEGGFMAYGPSVIAVFADMIPRQLIKLFRGARPADLPVEQPTRFDLVVNLRIARALGVDVPQTLLARADEVIE
jgi:putative ABC transport system substrate-binding protein